MRRRASGYDQAGNPGGVYSMSNPPPGKRFGAFVNGGKAIQWAPANAPISVRQRHAQPPSPSHKMRCAPPGAATLAATAVHS